MYIYIYTHTHMLHVCIQYVKVRQQTSPMRLKDANDASSGPRAIDGKPERLGRLLKSRTLLLPPKNATITPTTCSPKKAVKPKAPKKPTTRPQAQSLPCKPLSTKLLSPKPGKPLLPARSNSKAGASRGSSPPLMLLFATGVSGFRAFKNAGYLKDAPKGGKGGSFGFGSGLGKT